MILGRAHRAVDMTVLIFCRVSAPALFPRRGDGAAPAGAHDTYLRTYRGVLDANRVVEFNPARPACSSVTDFLFAEYGLRHTSTNAAPPNSRVGATAEAQRPTGVERAELLISCGPGVPARIAVDALWLVTEAVSRRLRSCLVGAYFHADVGRLV